MIYAALVTDQRRNELIIRTSEGLGMALATRSDEPTTISITGWTL